MLINDEGNIIDSKFVWVPWSSKGPSGFDEDGGELGRTNLFSIVLKLAKMLKVLGSNWVGSYRTPLKERFPFCLKISLGERLVFNSYGENLRED